jgi:hypothetical protein
MEYWWRYAVCRVSPFPDSCHRQAFRKQKVSVTGSITEFRWKKAWGGTYWVASDSQSCSRSLLIHGSRFRFFLKGEYRKYAIKTLAMRTNTWSLEPKKEIENNVTERQEGPVIQTQTYITHLPTEPSKPVKQIIKWYWEIKHDETARPTIYWAIHPVKTVKYSY